MFPFPLETWLQILKPLFDAIGPSLPLRFDDTPEPHRFARSSYHSEEAKGLRSCAVACKFLNGVVSPHLWEYICVDDPIMLERIARVAKNASATHKTIHLKESTRRIDLCVRFQKWDYQSLCDILLYTNNLKVLIIANRPPRVSPPILLPPIVSAAIGVCVKLEDLQFRDAFEVPSFHNISLISKECRSLRRLQITNLHCDVTKAETWGPLSLGQLDFPHLCVLKLGNGVRLHANDTTTENLTTLLQIVAGNLGSMPFLTGLHIMHPVNSLVAKLPLLGEVIRTVLFRGRGTMDLPSPEKFRCLQTLVVDIIGWQRDIHIPVSVHTVTNIHLRIIPNGVTLYGTNDLVRSTVTALEHLTQRPPPKLRNVTVTIPGYPWDLRMRPLVPFSAEFKDSGVDFVIRCHPVPDPREHAGVGERIFL